MCEFESNLFEQLKRQIAHDCGMEITVTRTEVGGVCENCRSLTQSPEGGASKRLEGCSFQNPR